MEMLSTRETEQKRESSKHTISYIDEMRQKEEKKNPSGKFFLEEKKKKKKENFSSFGGFSEV